MKRKNLYSKPRVSILNLSCGECMIEIGSGTTTPEENDAKASFFDDIIIDKYSPWE